ncbi:MULTISPECIES: acyl-CoA dehydrogenase family protein [unclassified Mycobacterium]|uniref:acyl-CoA dehydrogenase family protein n=1 Tax=unclassified Mycobacterium TaxID=2642494 RepID=UPI0007FFB20E|nr:MULTISPECIES: acyl-CoA dehydrogenase family protein [unclassified Mycobacterium]OBG79260.1 acyl-CoA dehydrogenase [Mycobacterium sp. E1214]OBH29474.1 acyl-CoA dehydrogenase [Mycobacterium sp. E1319]
MNLELTDEQVALRDTTRRFLAEKAPISPHVRGLLDDSTGTTDTVWRGLANLGVIGLLVPEEHGGAGMTMVEAGVVAEELGAALNPGPWPSSAVAAARLLLRLNVPAAELMTGIADGTTVVTVCLPEAGHPGLTAGRHGADAVVRGALGGVPDAAAADVLLVVAEEREGAGLFAVRAGSPGLSVQPNRGIDPSRKRCRVAFDSAPALRLASAAPDLVAAVADDVLIAAAADALGAARAVMELAVEYAKTRKQFGQPIGSFQAIQHLCVDMYETVELARGGVIHALWAADHAEPGERQVAALRLKGFAGRLASVGDTAIQVLGGIGYTWEHDAHLYLKRLLGWSAFRGASDRYLTDLGVRLAKGT